ncbi:MAG: HAD-IA family hydrolase [Planctomycetota bacterium]|nr:HAD-IA family hydrolase [Planctomycetota bacterium]
MNAPRREIEAVIFDLGRVLIDFEWRRAEALWARMAATDFGTLRARILGGTDFHGYERGELDTQAYFAQVRAVCDEPLDFTEFKAAWNAIFIDEIEPTVSLARRLHASGRVKVGILSNTNALHAEFLRARMPLLGELAHVFLSQEIGARKPEAAAYRHVLRGMGVAAERSVFVDDMEENVAAASRLGMHGVLASSPQAVREALERLGLQLAGNDSKT